VGFCCLRPRLGKLRPQSDFDGAGLAEDFLDAVTARPERRRVRVLVSVQQDVLRDQGAQLSCEVRRRAACRFGKSDGSDHRDVEAAPSLTGDPMIVCRGDETFANVQSAEDPAPQDDRLAHFQKLGVRVVVVAN